MRERCIHHLKETILPFWMARGIDRETGGFYSCFANASGKLVSTDKYVWSQGRMVWLFSKLSRMRIFTREEREAFLRLAARGAEFLMAHARLPNGNCAFVLTREGTPKPAAPDGATDTSIYADCFVIYGLSAYAAERGDARALAFARDLWASVRERFERGGYRSEPYPEPAGWKMHGFPMIDLMVSEELLAASPDAAVDAVCAARADEILRRFVAADGSLREMVRADGSPAGDTLFDRFVNPGHTLEDMWIVIHHARRVGDEAMAARAIDVAARAFDLGWDGEYGGLTLYADCEGGAPRGSLAGIEGERMAAKVREDWDSKLWWVHSEALYATRLAWRLTGRDDLAERNRRVADYAFGTFPDPDQAVGEWIQIRDRKGAPSDKVVALPVKDPFHIPRNLIQIIELEV